MRRLAILGIGAIAALGIIAGCSSGSDSSTKAAAPATTAQHAPLDVYGSKSATGWTAAEVAMIPQYFSPAEWDVACVTGHIEAAYANSAEYLDDLHTIGSTAMVSKTGLVACYTG